METVGTSVRIGFCCVIASAGAALSIAACTDGPGIGQIDAGRLPRVFCERLIECSCIASTGVDGESGEAFPPSCDAWNLGEFFPNPAEFYADDDGGEYGYDDDDDSDPVISFDPECADRIADLIANAPCGQPLPELPCESYCSLYFGPGLEGHPCEADVLCGRGLRCVRGECRDACQDRPAGEGEPCSSQGECDRGLVCVPRDIDGGDSEDAVCVSLPAAGRPCLLGACADGYWCDTSSGESVCAVSTPAGGACMGHTECASGFCPAGFCDLPPGAGEPCGPQGQCAAPADCVEDDDGNGTCVADLLICFGLVTLPYASFYDPYDDYY